jgi:MFS family permease
VYDYISQYKSGHECLGATVFVTTILILLTNISALALIPLDKKRISILKPNQSETNLPKVKLRVIFEFPLQLWLLCLVCTLNYGVYFTFTNLGKPFLIKKYEHLIYEASTQISLFFLSLVVFPPIFGALINLIGYNLLWIVFSSCLAICNHIFLAFTYISPFLALTLMGVSVSILNALLSTILTETVKENQLGAAFGLLQSILNLCLVSFNIMGGFIIQSCGYCALELFNYYLSIGNLRLLFSIFLLEYFIKVDKFNLKKRH